MIFTVTKEHLKLLKRMSVTWNDCESGAPSIDPKRPYGNSNIPVSMAKILKIEFNEDDGELKPSDENRMYKLHREMETVLAIVIQTGKFKAGKYKTVAYGPWRTCE